ncbi:MarR family transcriptional regulator [Amycolatopsis acidicola]|uniref:MarR family transcriptional regulator n=2 Tax=Amycolatopsis acidicola TaxID=2596893 RepID=A0A5N0V101_9PSEU|nr:MarR family transcriptional regulator [Amycolatopsis acidicola]
MRIARLVRADSSAEIAPHLYSVLTQLEHQPRTATQLADRDRVSGPAMTRTINALQRLDYVSRSADPDDGRHVIVSLTPEGAKTLRRVKRNRDAWMASRLEKLSDQELTVLAEAARILHKIQEE